MVSQWLQENWDSQAWMDHTIQKDWKSIGVTRLFLPLGILWLTIQEPLWIKRRSVWHIWKSMLSLQENHCFLATSQGSCHPCPHTFMVWPKMPQNGKSMYSLWSLKPRVPYVPRNVTWQRYTCPVGDVLTLCVLHKKLQNFCHWIQWIR